MRTTAESVFFDSGSSYNYLPFKEYDWIKYFIGEVVPCAFNNKHNFLFCKCTGVDDPKFPAIHFHVGEEGDGFWFKYDPKYYLQEMSKGQCAVLFRPELSWEFSDRWLLGQPFMRNFYLIHDMTNSRMSMVKVADVTREQYKIEGYISICTKKEEDNIKNLKRVTSCSSLNTCYDFKANKYLNSNCEDYNSCGKMVISTR